MLLGERGLERNFDFDFQAPRNHSRKPLLLQARGLKRKMETVEGDVTEIKGDVKEIKGDLLSAKGKIDECAAKADSSV